MHLTLLFPAGYAIAEGCKSSKEDSWLCQGDKGWFNGYLVKPSVMTELLEKEALLETVINERDVYQSLTDRYQDQNKILKEQRDTLRDLLDSSAALRKEYREQRDNTEKELIIVEDKLELAQLETLKARAEADASWAPWEVGLLASGVSVLSVLVGVGIYGLVAGF